METRELVHQVTFTFSPEKTRETLCRLNCFKRSRNSFTTV